jgi:D-lactate dehydrogenase
MRIAVFEVEPWERDAFKPLAERHELSFTEHPLKPDETDAFGDSEVLCPFIYSDLSGQALQRFPHLRLIATRSTGVDHIDRDYCADHDIVVSNVPAYGESTVAEHVFALLLTISHNTFHAIDRTRKGDFSLQGLRGFDLAGKTLGVIGTGGIGEHVIRIARGFGMHVVAFDLKPRETLAGELAFTYRPLDQVLADADVITLHVPGTDETRHMISHEQFQKMKDGVVLINTARGCLVDVQALMQAFADGKVHAAGLDVLPEEPAVREEAELLRSVFYKRHNLETLLANHVLLRLRNVYITPHSAFCTQEAVQRILDVTTANIEAYARGDPQNVAIGASAAAHSASRESE